MLINQNIEFFGGLFHAYDICKVYIAGKEKENIELSQAFTEADNSLSLFKRSIPAELIAHIMLTLCPKSEKALFPLPPFDISVERQASFQQVKDCLTCLVKFLVLAEAQDKLELLNNFKDFLKGNQSFREKFLEAMESKDIKGGLSLTVVFPKEFEGRSSKIKKGTNVVIGRGDNVGFFIPSTSISRTHCQIKEIKEGFVVEDMQSKNGTFVNGVAVRQSFLNDGDELRLGVLVMKIQSVPPLSLFREEK